MDQHSELLVTGLVETYTPPKSMSVREIMKELKLEENMENFGILLNEKKVDLDTIVEPHDKLVIIPHLKGGSILKTEIQCPECGGMIHSGMIENDFDERMYYCNKCGKNFTEAEIRERCGI